MEKDLQELVNKLKVAAGANLRSIVLYGSGATGDFHPKFSDLNVLCVLGRLDSEELQKLSKTAMWWTRKGHPSPYVFTLEELRQSADVFAIELWDIKSSRKVLFGEDVFDGLDVPMGLHRIQVEREMRASLVRLRQRYLAATQDSKSLLGLMTAALSTFVTLFRHTLIVLGEEPSQRKRDVMDRLGKLLGLDMAAFHTVLDVREGKRRQKEVAVGTLFPAFLQIVTRVVEEVDRRLGPAGRI